MTGRTVIGFSNVRTRRVSKGTGTHCALAYAAGSDFALAYAAGSDFALAYAAGSDATGFREIRRMASYTSALAYFITYHTYGTWLHGNEAGSVDSQHNIPGTPMLPSDPVRKHERVP